MELIHGDCLEAMKDIPDGSVDMVMTDPPYGTTACKWDSIIPLEPIWEQLKRLIKPNGAIVMTASQPFTTTLIHSNMKMFKYCWVWEKTKCTGFMNAKARPIKTTEDVVVFSLARCDGAGGLKNMTYNPQGLTGIDKVVKNSDTIRAGMRTKQKNTKYTQTSTGYPKNLINISSESKAVHPTQKPVALMEYLIKTYTNNSMPTDFLDEGYYEVYQETVLDFTMGSGTTGVACKNLGRYFIGIEKDDKYFNIAKNRIEGAKGLF